MLRICVVREATKEEKEKYSEWDVIPKKKSQSAATEHGSN